MDNNYSNNEFIENFDLKAIIQPYIREWKWYILFAGLAVGLSLLYLRYNTPLYLVNSSILVKDDENGGFISSFEDIGIGKSQSKIENEIEIFK